MVSVERKLIGTIIELERLKDLTTQNSFTSDLYFNWLLIFFDVLKQLLIARYQFLIDVQILSEIDFEKVWLLTLMLQIQEEVASCTRDRESKTIVFSEAEAE